MAAITQRINNFLGGVSTQPDAKKIPGQVRDAINVYPDPALGLGKRPGIKYLDTLHDGTGTNGATGTDYATPALADAHWFFIDRDNDEIYIGCIVGNEDAGTTPADAAIHIWNAIPDADGNYRKSTLTIEGSGTADDVRKYLTAVKSDDYEVLTVQDTSIVVNKNRTVGSLNGVSPTKWSATIQLKKIEYSATYTVEIGSQTASYQTYNADVFTNNAGTDTKLNADTILTGLKTQIDALNINGLTVEKGPTYLEIESSETALGQPGSGGTVPAVLIIKTKGGVGGDALTHFVDEVDTATDLPKNAKHGRVVKIANTGSAQSTYYAEFKANAGAGALSDGFWEETLKPGASVGLDNSTMPHELVNTAKDEFTFKRITYTERLVGDDDTNSQPSFVGKEISGAFFNRNRLGFLTGENVSMSQSGEFFNFYNITATASTASDPVDLACSSVRPLQLHAALPSVNGMVLFSQSQQFLMYSESGNLTPQDSLINGMSNYEMDKNIKPVEVGTSIYFISKTPAWSRIFSYTFRGLQNPPQVIDIGKVVTEYIPSSITQLVSSPQNSFVCLFGETDKTVYFYRYYDNGETQEMQAWFKWDLPGKPLTINITQDKIYAVLQVDKQSAGGCYFMCSLDITKTPNDAILINSAGTPLNPYMDFYAQATALTAQDGGTKIDLPYDDVKDVDPVIIVKGTEAQQVDIIGQEPEDGSGDQSTASQSGTIDGDAGYSAPVERKTDSNGDTYWWVKRDLTSIATSRIIVGYKFNYDVKLPTLFLQQTPDGRKVDYAGYLGINRLKFSTGEIASFGLKLKVKGVRGRFHEFTYTNSRNFSLPFKPHDKYDLAVRVNDANTSKFTCNDQGVVTIESTVTMNTNDKVLIYEDYYYVEETAADLDYYEADDVAIPGQAIYTFPVNQRNTNVEIRVFSNLPFPLSLSSMVWEGQYSPRYIRRA